MSSIAKWLGGYLKQFLGEVVGNQALHEKGKNEVLIAFPDRPGKAARTSVTDLPLSGGRPEAAAGSIHFAGSRSAVAFVDRSSSHKDKLMSVYTQLLPEIEPGSGPFAKISSDGIVLYVALPLGEASSYAKDALVTMADRLTAKPQRAAAPADTETRDEHETDRGADAADDLDDRLQVGLEDSFPASDPPAAVTSSILPRTHRK